MSDAVSFDEFQDDDLADFLLWTMERSVADYQAFLVKRPDLADKWRIATAKNTLEEMLHNVR